MEGYDDATYGDAFADVYDEWYADVTDVEATVAALARLAEGGAVLELGVGTGRLAVPLASTGRDAGITVTGIDTSEAMLDRLRQRDPDGLVTPVHGSMADPLPGGPYRLVFAAYNTIFNLRTPATLGACFAAVANVLEPGGRFVVEAFVPGEGDSTDVSVRSLTADRVVLSVSLHHGRSQVAEGQFVEFTEAGGVRLRPWSIRYARPHELDALATGAGLSVEHRWADFDGSTFVPSSERHVSVYRRT